MATVAELDRLKALSARLTPLAQVESGELIRAQDWNTLVSALLEVAQAVLADESSNAVPPHEHPDQVNVGWLDPRLRSLVERGPLSDPAAVTRLTNLEQKVERLASRIEEVNGSLKELRDRLTEVATRDLTRQADVTQLRRTVDGVNDSRAEVLNLRDSLTSIQKDLGVAVNVGQRLTADGQPVDIQALVNRVKNVEQVRERLTAPNGELLDARNLENRLTALSNKFVSNDQLDTAIQNRPVQVAPEALKGIQDQVQTSLTAQLNTSLASATADIRSETTNRLADVSRQISQTISDSLPNLTTSVLNTVRPEITASVTTSQAATQGLIEKRLGETQGTLQENLGRQLADLKLNLSASVQSEFAAQLPVQLAPINKTVAELAGQVTPVTGRLAEQDEALKTISARIETVSQTSVASQAAVRQEILGQLDQRDKTLSATIESRIGTITASQQSLRGELLGEISKQVATVNEGVNKRFNQRQVSEVVRNEAVVAQPNQGVVNEINRRRLNP